MSPDRRHFNNTNQNLPKPDYHHELLQSLSRINSYNPPVHTCSTGWSFAGFYKGPTSIAYLFYRLSLIYPDLQFKSQSLLEWAEDYLKLSQFTRHSDTDPDHCGIANETLAHLALSAIITNDAGLVRRLCGYESVVNRGAASAGSNEWLYGRAGYLYFLRICRERFQEQASVGKLIDQTISKTVTRMVETPMPWMWHGKQYLGAAHGYIGSIAQIVLSSLGIGMAVEGLEALLGNLLDMQFESGNFPSSADAIGKGAAAATGSDRLVQFCHGGPGFVTSVESIKQQFSPELQIRIKQALDKAKDDVWNRGLLTKSPCLCHGIAGNALSFTSTDDDRFERFLESMTTEQMELNGAKHGWMEDAGVTDGFTGMFTGEAGRAWVWAVADMNLQRRVIGFNDA